MVDSRKVDDEKRHLLVFVEFYCFSESLEAFVKSHGHDAALTKIAETVKMNWTFFLYVFYVNFFRASVRFDRT